MEEASPISQSRDSGSRAGARLLGLFVDAGHYTSSVERVLQWVDGKEARYVCAANVHMVMEAWDDPGFGSVVEGAALTTSDGMPLVWWLRRKGFPKAERVYGPTLMKRLCAAAAEKHVKVAFFGDTVEVLGRLNERMRSEFPGLEVVASISPVFGAFTQEQENSYCEQLRASGAQMIFVALGCPRQERFMAAVSRRLPSVMIGVGAAFSFHAGVVKQAPAWMQRCGLEWLFRLCVEPRRLWKRYLWNNPRFVFLVIAEGLGLWRPRVGQGR